MENSLIIKFFSYLARKFLIVYNDSAIEKVIGAVCGFFKRKAAGSFVCRYMSGGKRDGAYFKNSFLMKVLTFPLRLIMKIGSKIGETVEKISKNSLAEKIMENILNIPICNISRLTLVYGICAAAVLFVKGSIVTLDGLLLSLVVLLSAVGLFIPATAEGLTQTSGIFNVIASLFNRYNIKNDKKVPYKTEKTLILVILAAIFGIFAGFTSFIYCTVGIIGALCVALVLKYTIFGIFLFVFFAPIMPTMVCVGLVMLTAVSFGLRLLTGREKIYKVTAPSFFIIGFLLVAAFSSLTSFNASRSVQSYAIYLIFAISYFLIVNNIKTKNQWYNLVVAFAIAGLIVGLYGIYQNFFISVTDTSWIDEDMFEDIRIRVFSTFDNPNVLGQYLVLSVPVVFSLMWSEKRVGAKIFYAFTVAAMCACMIFTWSRAAWVGIMLAIGFFMVMKDRRWASVLVVMLLIMPFVLPESIISRITSLGNMNDSSTAYRFSVWMSSLRIAKDYWISGIGLGAGAFERVYQKYALNGAGFALHSHNFYIQLVVEMGILGIILFMFIIISSYRRIITMKHKKSVNRNVAIAMGGALLGYLFQGVAENLWYNYRMILIFFVYLGILHSGANIDDGEVMCTIEESGIKG